MKTAIYVRSATKNDVAIKAQIKFCKDVLDDEDIVVYADNGYSAHDQNRPAFKNMIKDIEDGNVNKVIAYKIDRLCRDLNSLCRSGNLSKHTTLLLHLSVKRLPPKIVV